MSAGDFLNGTTTIGGTMGALGAQTTGYVTTVPYAPPPSLCPTCGRCPTCGGHARPSWGLPSYPWYTSPSTYCGN